MLAGPVIGTITVASLPEPLRRRAALPEIPGAQTLMQSVYVAVGLARFLPDNRLRAEGLTSLLHLSSDNDVPQAATPTALRRRMTQVGALFRLVTPFAARHGPAERTGRSGALTNSPPRCWTRPATATWTGPLSPPWPGSCPPGAPEETRLRHAYAEWWRELQAALDIDGDGRISKEEYAAAVPSLAGPALIRVDEALFDVTDADGKQFIDADEYRALFRTGFRRTVADAGARCSRGAFVKDFLSFASGRRHSTAHDPLLADA
ncbi:EF-hand domain-containing protein [Streptomyces sp. NPDC087862]|uniref:EF-hand domain-containing protein n=1 Tax=Streptomyces sp. NPDC087862 TaxID=3365813 RepID=UPI00380308A3